MRVRDAVESDAETLATIIDRPQEAVVNMIHDRSVRVAVSDDSDADATSDSDADVTSDSDADVTSDSDADVTSDSGTDTTSDSGTDTTSDGMSRAPSSTQTVEGFVAFDVHGDAVHVTDFGGDRSVIHRLLEEPKRFAGREGLTVEVTIPDDEESGSIVEAVGFEPVEKGPLFEGRTTTRYRIEAKELSGKQRGE